MSSGYELMYQLPLTKKIKLPVITEPEQDKQFDFSSKLHNKHVTGEPYILFGIDRYSKRPAVRIWKSTVTKEFIKFPES